MNSPIDPTDPTTHLRMQAARQTRRWAQLHAWDAWLTLLIIGVPVAAVVVIALLIGTAILFD